MPAFARKIFFSRSEVSLSNVVLMVLAAVSLAACSADNNGASAGAASAIEGAFIDVDGQRFAVNEVRRCEPYPVGPYPAGEDSIRLLVFGPDRLVVNISLTTHDIVGESHEMSIKGSKVGIFGGSASPARGEWTDQDRNVLSGPPFERDNGQLSGALTLYPASTQRDQTRDVSFVLPIPAEMGDCP